MLQCATARPTGHTVSLLLGTLVAGQQVRWGLLWLMLRMAVPRGFCLTPACTQHWSRLAACRQCVKSTLHPPSQVDHALWLIREALASGYDVPTAAFNNLLQVGKGAQWMLHVDALMLVATNWERLGSGMLEHADVACQARAGGSAQQCSAESPGAGAACTKRHASLCSSPMVQLLAGRGEWERALAVHRAMTLASVRLDSTTAGLLVAACTQGGNQQLAAQLAAVSWGRAVRGTERWIGLEGWCART